MNWTLLPCRTNLIRKKLFKLSASILALVIITTILPLGMGGYCLPKDTKQLLRNFDQVPQKIMEAIIDSNTMRKDFLGLEIARLKPKCVGVYRLAMKEGSDNIRESSMQGIMKRVKSKGIPMIIYEPLIKESSFYNSSVYQDLEQFKKDADLIICNRNSPELKDVQEKIFTRDLFQQD